MLTVGFQMQKKQDHILWTLESKKIDHEQIDIGDPNREKDRQFMRENVDSVEKTKTVLPPQIFNDETYVGVSTCCAFCRAMLCMSAAYAVARCLSVCPLRSCMLSKRVNISSNFVRRRVATPI